MGDGSAVDCCNGLMCSIKRAMYVNFADIDAKTLELMPAQPPRDLAGQVIPVRFYPGLGWAPCFDKVCPNASENDLNND